MQQLNKQRKVRERRMSAKDTTAKDYMSDNFRFADLFNYMIFGGRPVISADTLITRDSTEIISFFDEEDSGKSIKLQKWRDLLKAVTIKTNDEAIFAILGIENQSEVHYAMVVRNLLYDAISYAKQADDIAREHRRQKDTSMSSEFLSGFTSRDKLKPVITLTVYWGCDPWDGPRSLYEMLNTGNRDILRFVSDYKLNLIVPGEIEDFSHFQSELGKLFNIFKCANDKEAINALLKDDAYQSVKIETIDMMNTFLGMNIPKDSVNKEGEINMCKAWEDQRNEDLATGRAEGRAEGRVDAIQRMIRKGCTKEFILELEYTEEEYIKAEEELAAMV